MSKLLQLKEWLEIDDVAKYLSIKFGEPVSRADVLRLGLDGHLQMSVYFVNHAQARKGKKLIYADAEKFSTELFDKNLPPKELICGLKFYDEKTKLIEYVVQFEKNIVSINGVWDLTMLGGERLDVEHQYQMLTNEVEVTLINIDGTYISTPDGEIFELQERFDDDFIKSKDKTRFNDPDNYFPAGGLPDDSVLVVRTIALESFEININKSIETVSNKPLTEKERETLLVIIAALAKEAKIDIEKISKAGDLIANMTQLMGVPIGATTIETHLKKINQAIANRTK